MTNTVPLCRRARARRRAALQLAVVGAGPVGLALALHAAQALPQAAGHAVRRAPGRQGRVADPRTLALSLGSVQLLQRLGAWRRRRARSRSPRCTCRSSRRRSPAAARLPATRVLLRASDEGVPMLGAVLSYGALVGAAAARVGSRGRARAAAPASAASARRCTALKTWHGGVEVDAGIAERFDLAVVAEGGVFVRRQPTRRAAARGRARTTTGQTAWVGSVDARRRPRRRWRSSASRATARPRCCRCRRPRPTAGPALRAASWCGACRPTTTRCSELDDAQRLAVLNTLFPPLAGRLVEPDAAEARSRSACAPSARWCDGRTVRIGNAAQTLHPVAGQGLNLGLRDAFALVRRSLRAARAAAARRRAAPRSNGSARPTAGR